VPGLGAGRPRQPAQVIAWLQEARRWAEAIEPRTDIQVIDVQLNLARALQPAELMHHIIRRLYETLVERGVLPQLPSKLQAELELAYYRTSFNMTASWQAASSATWASPTSGSKQGGASSR
jgi:hypothetical protein